jgi:AcrR family transcriptional regulator
MNNANTNERIKEKAKELFFSYGLKSVSMDDIAKWAAISKRTMYEFFDGKDELVNQIVLDIRRSYSNLFKIANSAAENAIDEVIKQEEELLEILANIRPVFFFDLEKTLPDNAEELNYLKLIVLKGIIRNLRRGKEEGNYRENIDVAIVSDLRFHQLINLMKPKLLTGHELSISQLAREYTMLYLQAITTEKGKNLFDRYFNEKKTLESLL